ncbi:MAG: methyltransferase domain-containing protein [Pseudomonadota bacterium]
MLLRTRSSAPEIMDDAGQTEAAFRTALTNLEWLTRVTLGYRPTLRFLDEVVARSGARSLSILDVGAGGGDMLRRIAQWGERRGIDLTLTGCDLSPWAEQHAREVGTPAEWITGDVFALPEGRRFDIILCSLFTHHLNEPQLVRFLRLVEERAVRGWLISDLHRHWLSWAGLWVLVRVTLMDPMVRHDSTVSVARGFVGADWDAALSKAGVHAERRWQFPFRWSVAVVR